MHLGVCICTDDILVFVPTKEAHDDMLLKVLHCLYAKDFRIQLCKCVFSKHSMPFLGRIVSAEGLTRDPKNIVRECRSLTHAPRGLSQTNPLIGRAHQDNSDKFSHCRTRANLT